MSRLKIFLLFMLSMIGSLPAATLPVGPPPASIQAVINVANPGDTVLLSAGTYTEELKIVNKDLNLVGQGQNLTILNSPGPATALNLAFISSGINYFCVITAENTLSPATQTVNISNLTVNGNNQQTSGITNYGFSNRLFGIGYHNAAGTVENVRVTEMRNIVSPGQLAGGGILNISEAGVPVIFNVNNCLVDFYQRNGIVGVGPNLIANVSNNSVLRSYALPPLSGAATPNGITYAVSCQGTVANNMVDGNIATQPNASGSGINMSSGGPNLLVSMNTVTNSDLGILASNCGANLTIQNNTINYNLVPNVNPAEGIIVRSTVGLTTLSSNIMNVPDFSMELLTINGTDQPFQLSNNQFNNSNVGLLVYGLTGAPSHGPQIQMNGDSFTGTGTYYIQEVTAPNTAPNDIWPSTATVSFDGLVSGFITLAEYNQIRTKIFDQLNDPTLGLVLDYIIPSPPILTSIAADFGPSIGGNTITITGSGFISSDTQVFFGAVPGTNVVVVDNNTITVTVPAGVGTVDVIVVTPFGVTPIVAAGEYTYIEGPVMPLPPTNFTGKVSKAKFFNKKVYSLNTTWGASPSPDVLYYRIYKNGHAFAETSASTFSLVCCLKPKNSADEFSIVAVNSMNVESLPVPITIVP